MKEKITKDRLKKIIQNKYMYDPSRVYLELQFLRMFLFFFLRTATVGPVEDCHNLSNYN